jgi:hypothetical protein
MFECNDNNLLLILGIGIIVLILLKLIYYNNDKPKKHYRNLNCTNNNEDNYENFETDVYYKKDYNTPDEKTIENFKQKSIHANVENPVQAAAATAAAVQAAPAVPGVQAAAVQAAPAHGPGEHSASTQSVQKQISITVPLIDNNIFNPNKIDFDYADASNNIYTLGVKDNPTEVKAKQEQLTSDKLLPGKSEKKWFENPDVGIKIEDANLLSDAIQKVGVDTVGQTRKNPSYDIRGTVPCPKFQISPWNNSTTEPDYNLKSLY